MPAKVRTEISPLKPITVRFCFAQGGNGMKYSEWHLKRFSEGASPIFRKADDNLTAAHRFLVKIISLDSPEYSLLLLRCIYFFVFFAETDKKGRNVVSFSDIKNASGYGLSVKNPYPVFLRAENLGIKSEMLTEGGTPTVKRREAEYVSLSFSDRKVFRGLAEFAEGAEKRFSLSARQLYKKMFSYFAAADFSFIKEADDLFIKEYFLAGYEDYFYEATSEINELLSFSEFFADFETVYKENFVQERIARKRGTKTFLFSVEFGKRKDSLLFRFNLSTRSVLKILRKINEFSQAFVVRFLHDGDCRCDDCRRGVGKVIYKNKVYSSPLSEGIYSFPLKNEADFSDAVKIIGEIISSLPAYARLLRALAAYKDGEERK